tara:strand:- start:910 stop:1101 length:192 start_codon:yes stop_codon:yes gene_type:complete
MLEEEFAVWVNYIKMDSTMPESNTISQHSIVVDAVNKIASSLQIKVFFQIDALTKKKIVIVNT